jgi:sRNA-binding protein
MSSNQRPPASDLLPLLTAAFPHTFFADPKSVRPLKINIHRDLNDWRKAQTLPVTISVIPLRRFMHWYTQRTAYLKALARGESRVDLTGAEVDRDIPEAIREQARQEIARRQALKTGPADTRKAAQAHRAAVAVLSRLAAAFPQTFFADPKQVRPLKVFLYRDLLRLAKTDALPEGIDRAALKSFLHWYGRRTAYLTAIKLSEFFSITMLFLSTVEIQQGSGRGFLAGRMALRTHGSWIGLW